MFLYDEVCVWDDQDCDVKFGEIGYLLIWGLYMIWGYYKVEEYNVVFFIEDGFYCMGDIVRLILDGYIVVEGRVKD